MPLVKEYSEDSEIEVLDWYMEYMEDRECEGYGSHKYRVNLVNFTTSKRNSNSVICYRIDNVTNT